MKHKFVLSLALIFVLAFCSACQNPIVVERRPCSQPNTKWMSEDKKIVFTVDDNNHAMGEMFLDGGTIGFYMTNDMGSGMHLFDLSVIDTAVETTENEYEYWICSYKSKKEFIAIVKKTTYFDVGEKIVFHRMDGEDIATTE